MKTKFYVSWKAVLVLAGLPLVAAALQAPPADEPKPGASVPDVASLTAVAEMPGGQLATNQAEAVSATNARPSGPMLPNLQLYGGTAEIVKLAQSGVGEGVMLSYISNTPARFSLGSDQIIYLNDLGVSSSVVTAMIQHDAAQDAAGAALPPATSAYPSNQTYVATYPPGQTPDQPIPATGADYSDYNTYPPADYSTPDDTAYFYDTLAPYGSWINLPGYGLCWQPVVCVRNHDWRPYNDRGRWLYTDCGWYWHSDYSWGSTAFHYGRWFHDANTGWVWAPNRVWGPAWVSWRSSAEYTGWAPLPPSAHFVPGAGFRFQNHAVDANFEFGLHRNLYTFVPTERLADYSPGRYRITGAQSVGVFNQTAVINHFDTVNHQVVNHGVDPAQVEARSGAPIRRAVIRDLAPGSGNGRTQPDRLDKQGDSLVVFRPQLPATPVRNSGAVANGNGGSPTGRRFETTSSRNSGAPNATPVVSVASPTGIRPVTGAPTLFGADRENKPRVQVYERRDPPPAGPTTITPAPARTTATANPGNPAMRGTPVRRYPPNSLVLDGRKNLTEPQHAPPSSPMNAGSSPAQPGRTSSQTFTVYQRPDLSGNSPPPGAAPRVAMSQDGSSSQRFTVYERPDLSSVVQPDQGAGSHQLPARGYNDYSRGYGNQTSPSSTSTQPGQSSSPAQAPVLLPSRGYGNNGYSQPANNSAPAYAPPAGRSAPAQNYNPQPQPVMLPPSHSQPAPAPAAPSHASAPAQSSQSSSSQSSSSQSSGRR